MIRQRIEGIFPRRLEKVLKTPLQDVLKTFWRRLEDVLKTFTEDEWLRRIYSSWWRRLEDVCWRRRRKTSSSRLQDVFIKTNVWWVKSHMLFTCTNFIFQFYMEKIFCSRKWWGIPALLSLPTVVCNKSDLMMNLDSIEYLKHPLNL